jgi:hypothetical protein
MLFFSIDVLCALSEGTTRPTAWQLKIQIYAIVFGKKAGNHTWSVTAMLSHCRWTMYRFSHGRCFGTEDGRSTQKMKQLGSSTLYDFTLRWRHSYRLSPTSLPVTFLKEGSLF